MPPKRKYDGGGGGSGSGSAKPMKDAEEEDENDVTPPPEKKASLEDLRRREMETKTIQAMEKCRQDLAGVLTRNTIPTESQLIQLLEYATDGVLYITPVTQIAAQYINQVELKLDSEHPIRFVCQGLFFNWSGPKRVLSFNETKGEARIKINLLTRDQLSLIDITTLPNRESYITVKCNPQLIPYPQGNERMVIRGAICDTEDIRMVIMTDSGAQVTGTTDKFLVLGEKKTLDVNQLEFTAAKPESFQDLEERVGFNHDGSLMFAEFDATAASGNWAHKHIINTYDMKGSILSSLDFNEFDNADVLGFVQGTNMLLIKSGVPSRIYQYDVSQREIVRPPEYFLWPHNFPFDEFLEVESELYPIQNGIWYLASGVDRKDEKTNKCTLYFMEYSKTTDHSLIIHRYSIGEGDRHVSSGSLLPDGSICVLFFPDEEKSEFILHVVHPHAQLYTMSRHKMKERA